MTEETMGICTQVPRFSQNFFKCCLRMFKCTRRFFTCFFSVHLGREEPALSMDVNGKIVWAKHSEIQQANIKAIGDQEIKDGERIGLAIKDMGSCEVYPQNIAHNPNGR